MGRRLRRQARADPPPGKEFGFFKEQKPLVCFNTQEQDEVLTLNNQFGGSDWRKTRAHGRRPPRKYNICPGQI